VVVSCQKCRTRFQLDEARIPAKGVKVRCSKCKHAFFVAKPGSDAEAIHQIAEEAAATGRPAKPRPAPAVDLRAKDSEDDDWEFNIEPRGDDGPGAPTSPPPAELTDSEPADLAGGGGDGGGNAESFFELAGLPDRDRDAEAETAAAKAEAPGKKKGKAKSVPPAIEPEQEVDFRNLGKPEGWSSPGKRAAVPVAKAAKKAAKGASADAAQDDARAPVRSTLPRVDPGTLVGSLAGAAGWAGAALLLAFGLNGALAPPAADADLAPTAIGALEITDLEVRHVENLFAGPLVVVAGELRNPGADGTRAGAAPLVRVTDALGDALDIAPVWIGAAIPDDDLRRLDPGPIAAAQAEGARALGQRSFAANERVPVTALLADLPEEAVGFRIESVPIAELPVAPEPPPVPDPAETNDGAPLDDVPVPTNDGAPLDGVPVPTNDGAPLDDAPVETNDGAPLDAP
jgi:predicted Zn finger-like uncharacterized protein